MPRRIGMGGIMATTKDTKHTKMEVPFHNQSDYHSTFPRPAGGLGPDSKFAPLPNASPWSFVPSMKAAIKTHEAE